MSREDLENKLRTGGLSRKEFLSLTSKAAAGGMFFSYFTGCSSPTEPEPPRPPPTPNYVNSALDITDVFTGQSIPSGHVTFPNGKTIPISNGLAEVTSSQELLAGTYRVFVQPESQKDFVPHSRTIELANESVTQLEVLPWTHNEFSYEQMLEKFMHGDEFNKYTIRWPDGAELTSYHYDESHLQTGNNQAIFIRSQDPELIASQGFIEDTVAAYKQVTNWLPKQTNISLKSYVESEREIDFPTDLFAQEKNTILNAGWTSADWALTRGYSRNNQQEIIDALLLQKTGFPDSADFKAPALVNRDVIENFGIRTSGHGGLIGDAETIWKPIAPLLLTASYSFAPGSGLYKLDSALPAKNDSTVSVVEHYVP